MGRALARAIAETQGAEVVGAFDRRGSPVLGQDLGLLAGIGANGVIVGDDPRALLGAADGLIDFTAPAATAAHAGLAAQAGVAMVIGTTGLGPEEEAAVRAAAARGPIVKSGNMSLGVNLLAALVAQAAAVLGEDWDVEILEMHHRHKVDAPSGTALLLGEAAARARGVDLGAASVRVRDGHAGARARGSIGFQSLRGGSVTGDHLVILAGEGERVTLGHVAEDRAIFARGAVRAALWAQGRPPGLYSMADVLGLGS